MSFEPTITFGNVLTAISFLIAVSAFVIRMAPRIDNLEAWRAKNTDDIQKLEIRHEKAREETDKVISELAQNLGSLTAMVQAAHERTDRLDTRLDRFVEAWIKSRTENDRQRDMA